MNRKLVGVTGLAVLLSGACSGGGEHHSLRPTEPTISADWGPGSNCAEGHDLAAGWSLLIDGCPSGTYADQSGTFQYEFATAYQPVDPQIVVATYEYRYLSGTQFGVRLVDAVLAESELRPGWVIPFAVTNAFAVRYFEELAGSKFIGFVAGCPVSAASDPLTCWESRNVDDVHLEPRVCIDNSGNGTFGGPSSWCGPNPDDDFVHLLNRLPTASLSASQQSATPTSATWLLNGAGSSDPEAGALTYNWKITSPGGSVETVSTSSSSLTRVFTVAGTYTARLAVVDGGGGLDATSQQFVVTFPSGNQQPVAAFNHSCTYLSCTFTDTSTDPDGSIVAWNWSFGDGATSTVQNPNHTYLGGGTRPVRLIVTDNGGLTDSVTVSVTVIPPPPPLGASIDGPTEIGSLDVCTWYANVSNGQGPFSYEWKQNFTVVGTDASWMGGGTSTFFLKLKVTDNGTGQTVDTSIKVTVYQSEYVNPC